MKRYIVMTAALTVLAGCQPTLVAEFRDKAVVQAYLYADHAPEVRVSKLIAFRDDAVYSDEDVNALTVTVTDDTTDESVALSPRGDGLYSTDAMRVAAGHTYSLRMPYNGESVTATTEIPAKPTGMATSRTVITAMGFPGSTRQGGFGNQGAEITWDNPEGDYYMLSVENVETNPRPIFDEDEVDEDWPRPSFRVEPTQGTSAMLSQMSFSYYGRHNVILIRMRPEYALLYSTSGDTSQTLTEIHANVDGGYGIFTGANCDTLQVSVTSSSIR
ncbi:MAG: DUF4249 domain-containing protein [Alistipes sp.]|jgi:hypothetical protein|nr:DUF4249 domain-containing protein [Alistipes sp.]